MSIVTIWFSPFPQAIPECVVYNVPGYFCFCFFVFLILVETVFTHLIVAIAKRFRLSCLTDRGYANVGWYMGVRFHCCLSHVLSGRVKKCMPQYFYIKFSYHALLH